MGIESEQSAVEAPDVKREKAAAAATLARKRKTAAARRQRAATKPAVKDESKLSVEDEDGNLKTPAELAGVFKEAGKELKAKAKEVGLQPFRDLAALVVSGGLALVSVGLEALEGKKKKDK